MPWPTTISFTEAVQNPGYCFNTPELKSADVCRNRRGTPLIYSGNFACVYKVETPQRTCAIRCFTREAKNQDYRYNHLSSFLQDIQPPTFVDFEYHEQGIMTRDGHWYPIILMEWAEGRTLDKHIGDCLSQGQGLDRIAARWRGAVKSVNDLQIAHNDLQHGNVIVQNGQIRLVDYDGVFLPEFQGELSPETGHKNYQHPQRSAADYSAAIDNFPALIIHASILALQADPRLWSQFYNDDNLLLTNQDFKDPTQSQCLQAMKQNPDPIVGRLAYLIQEYCQQAPEEVPSLEVVLSTAERRGKSSPPTATYPTPNAAPVSTPTGPEPAQQNYSEILRRRQGGEPTPAAPPQNPAPATAPQTPPATTPAQPATRRCPYCRQETPAENPYCTNPQCSRALEPTKVLCSCGAEVPDKAKFCIRCGKPAVAGSNPNSPRSASPVGLLQRLLNSKSAGNANRTCSRCRAPIKPGSNFCTLCGQRAP